MDRGAQHRDRASLGGSPQRAFCCNRCRIRAAQSRYHCYSFNSGRPCGTQTRYLALFDRIRCRSRNSICCASSSSGFQPTNLSSPRSTPGRIWLRQTGRRPDGSQRATCSCSRRCAGPGTRLTRTSVPSRGAEAIGAPAIVVHGVRLRSVHCPNHALVPLADTLDLISGSSSSNKHQSSNLARAGEEATGFVKRR